jgi:hypothetical protein
MMSLETSFSAELQRVGWRQDGAGADLFSLPDGSAEIRRVADHADWECFAMCGPSMQPPARHQLLPANSRLRGPLKWVAQGGRPPWCRIDIPKQFTPLGQRGWDQSDLRPTGTPSQAWAATVTAIASGRVPDGGASDLPLDKLTDGLQQAGWAASVDDGQLRIHIQMPDLYRDIRLEQHAASDVRIAATLVELSGVAALSRRAIFSFALNANSRLHLARLAVASAGRARSLRAEVALPPCSACVLSGCLVTAVEAVYTAVSLCAREMLALRDAALAELMLASLAT